MPDLIKLIASGEHSGTLTVTDGTVKGTLFFREGRPVCATSRRRNNEVREHHQVVEGINDLFRWREASFTLDQHMGPQEGCSVLNTSTNALILAGARWVDSWSTIQRVVPFPNTVFERRDEEVSPSELDLTNTESRVLSASDGPGDVSDMARLCGLTGFETSKILYSLCTVGLVQPGDLGKVRLRRVFREFADLLF